MSDADERAAFAMLEVVEERLKVLTVDRPFRTASVALETVPDGWCKVDGAWRHVPTVHYVNVEGGACIVEHTLSCRFAPGGMMFCHFNMTGGLCNLPPGRYRLDVLGGEPVLVAPQRAYVACYPDGCNWNGEISLDEDGSWRCPSCAVTRTFRSHRSVADGPS